MTAPFRSAGRRAVPPLLLLASAWLGLAAACGASGDGDSDADADPDAADADDGVGDVDPDARFEVVPPAPPAAPPAAPAPPETTPCPAGWREIPATDAGDPALCDPWPETGRATCDGYAAHFPGEPGCVPVGSACPAGDFADDLPTDRTVLHVLAGAAPGGDGTETAPFATIGEALAVAEAGSIVAVSRGTFDEVLRLPAGVTLWGACVAETVLTSSEAADTGAVVLADGADTAVRNVRITGERPGLLVADARDSLDLQDVWVEGTRAQAVYASTGALTARTLVVRGTRSRASDLEVGHGLVVGYGGRAEVTRAALDDNRYTAVIVALPGSELLLADAVVAGTLPSELDDNYGQGLIAMDGGRVEATRIAVEGNRTAGVLAQGARTEIVLRDAVVRDTLGRAGTLDFGRGLDVQSGGAVRGERVRVEGSRECGLSVSDRDSLAVLTDLVIRDTLGQESDDGWGDGVWVQDGGRAELERAAVLRNRDAAVAVFAPGASASLTDVLLAGTDPAWADGVGGSGLMVDGGAAAEAIRAELSDNSGCGLLVRGAGTTVSVTDVAVRDTRLDAPEPEDRRTGYGVQVTDGASLDVRRGVLERNVVAGLLAMDSGTSVRLEDAAIRDTTHRPASFAEERRGGGGLIARDGAAVAVVRAVVERNLEFGMWAMGPGTVLTAMDVAVRDTESSARNGELGEGLVSIDGARVTAERGLLERNREAGLVAYGPGAELVFSDVEVLETRERGCAATTCAGAGGGIGAGAYGGGAMELTRLRIADGALIGVQIARGTTVDLDPYAVFGTVDLHEGDVVGHEIGANVQDPDFDVGRLMDRVRFINERNIDAETLPVPSPWSGSGS